MVNVQILSIVGNKLFFVCFGHKFPLFFKNLIFDRFDHKTILVGKKKNFEPFFSHFQLVCQNFYSIFNCILKINNRRPSTLLVI